MDTVLQFCDERFLDNLYGADIARDNPWRQLASLFLVVTTGGELLYLITAALSYHFLFDKRLMKHKLFMKNQVRREIIYAVTQIPGMSALTCPIFLAQLKGYGMLYNSVDDYGWPYLFFSCFAFLMFLDCGIYWAHWVLHVPFIYKHIHKPHHQWIIPTPFASHAFNFFDGFIQGASYHIAVFLFPVHKWVYLGFFFFVNVWTVSIHDGINSLPDWCQKYINGAAHHGDHHLYFNYNLGQFFTLWDKIGGTHRDPKLFKLDAEVLGKDLDDKEIPDCQKKDIEETFGKKTT